MSTENKFDALADKGDEENIQELQTTNGKGKETKQLVEETFVEKKKAPEECDTKSNEEGSENPMEKRQNAIPLDS